MIILDVIFIFISYVYCERELCARFKRVPTVCVFEWELEENIFSLYLIRVPIYPL